MKNPNGYRKDVYKRINRKASQSNSSKPFYFSVYTLESLNLKQAS